MMESGLGKCMEMLGVTRAYRLSPNTRHVVTGYEIVKSASKRNPTAPSTKSYVGVLPQELQPIPKGASSYWVSCSAPEPKNYQTALVSSSWAKITSNLKCNPLCIHCVLPQKVTHSYDQILYHRPDEKWGFIVGWFRIAIQSDDLLVTATHPPWRPCPLARKCFSTSI